MTYVLSIEGPAYFDKRSWSTHQVIGVFNTKEEAIAAVPSDVDDEDIVLITNVETGEHERHCVSDL